jgi:hypothetical protein
MFIKQKLLQALTKHPRVLTFGIGLAVTTTLAMLSVTVIGTVPSARA